MATPKAKWANLQYGDQMLYALPMASRLTQPGEQEGLMRDAGQLFDPGTNVIWRLRTIVWVEKANPYLMAQWLISNGRLVRKGRNDLIWEFEDGTITWPDAFFLGIERPDPGSPLEAKFSDGIVLNHVTDKDPI